MDLINELREILARFFVFYCEVAETCFAPQLSAANPIPTSIAKPAINDFYSIARQPKRAPASSLFRLVKFCN